MGVLQGDYIRPARRRRQVRDVSKRKVARGTLLFDRRVRQQILSTSYTISQIHVARRRNGNDMRVFAERLERDGVVEPIGSISMIMQRDQVLGVQWFVCDGIRIVVFSAIIS